MNELPLYIVDAFTATQFRGNPASVCLLERGLPEAMMQKIAAEMKHSETAFALPLDGSPMLATRFSLRWFTPEVEVPLCGHATLATSAVIFQELSNPAHEIQFETKSGRLSARRESTRIALDFPVQDFRPVAASPAVLAALGVREVEAACRTRNDRNLLLHLRNNREVSEVTPDFVLLRAAGEKEGFLGVIVTASGAGQYDFVSRYFAPWVGIDEDPVTGTAHCALTPYWARVTGRQEMCAYQASLRGGEIIVRLKNDRVDLVGEAAVVVAGRLRF
jgi:PhzF family phenazine biosynthesis protein